MAKVCKAWSKYSLNKVNFEMVVAIEAPNVIQGFLGSIIRSDDEEAPDHVDESTQKKANRTDTQKDKGQEGVVVSIAFRAVLSVHPCLRDEVDDGNQSDYHKEAVYYEENEDFISRPQQNVILLPWILETFCYIDVCS